MNKFLFDKYCTCLFDILFTLENRIDITIYDKYNVQVFGFLVKDCLMFDWKNKV